MLLSNLLRKGMVPKAQDLGILSTWDWGLEDFIYRRTLSASVEHFLAWSSVPTACSKK